jgi:hypothetical protein
MFFVMLPFMNDYRTILRLSVKVPVLQGYVLVMIAFGIVLTVTGLGLSRHKEWARSLTIILHLFTLLPVLGLVAFVLADLPLNFRLGYIGGSWLTIFLMTPIFHWCYFVIRTLTSPVVKYVCLRGGHDID